MENPDDYQSDPAEIGSRGRTPLIAACAVLVVTGCCCLFGAGLVVYLDPFDWNLVARLTGRYDAAAEAVPADAVAYVGIDLLQLQSAEADRVFRAFAASDPEGEITSFDDFLRDLDEDMARDAGFTLSEDVLPWVGRHAGLGITGFQFDESGEVASGEFVFAATIRDRAAAEAFSLLLRDRIQADSGDTLQVEDYKGATIYTLPTYQSDGIAFAIHRGTFLLSTTSAVIRTSIDAKSGNSFMETEAFRGFSGDLPAEAILTVFATSELIDELSGSISPGLTSTAALYPGNPFKNGALSFTFVPEGIRIDLVAAYDPETLTEARRRQLDLLATQAAIAARLPANTLAFYGGRGLDLTFDVLREQMDEQDAGPAFDESMASLEEQLGFSLENDLLANLDGEFAVVVLPSGEGLLAARDVDLGLAFLFETGNPAGLRPVLDGLGRLLSEELGVTPDPVDLDGYEILQVADPFIGEVAAYGLAGDLFLISTSARTAADVLRNGSTLAEDADFRAIWQGMPSELNPVLYVNMGALLGSIREGMEAEEMRIFNSEAGAALSPIEFIAMGNRHPSPERQMGTLIVFISGYDD